MNAVTQAKVLRALENRKIERLGGSQSIDVDVRVISATHRNLPQEIAAGKFREDLYYRIRVVTLELPALRDHAQDVAMLAHSFVKQLGARHSRDAKLIADAIAVLTAYAWPGNVRELRNALERTLVLSTGAEISAADLPEEIRAGKSTTQGAKGQDGSTGSDAPSMEFLAEPDFREAKRQFEIAFLRRKLEAHRWNVSKTAEEIGLHRQSLQEKLRELGIQRPVK
jgi:two-component system, NtrC family, nitrogen regulation response regulator NtrX